MRALGVSDRLQEEDFPAKASIWNLFGFCIACFALLWLPMALLQQVDALLRFATPFELLVDSALLLILLAAGSVVLGIIAFSLGFVARLGLGRQAADRLTWLLVSIPVGLLCVWQTALTLKLWVEQVAGGRFPTGGLPHRNVMALLLLVALLVAWRRFGVSRAIRGVVAPALHLRTPALAALALAVAVVAWQRPTIAAAGFHVPPPATAARSSAPDIFVITLDALAASDAGVCGTGATNMPQLRALAGRSTCFTRAYAASNLTFPSTTSIETATLPWTHWALYGGRLPKDLARASLGTQLQQAGYTTHSISAAPGASPLQHGTQPAYDSAVMAASSALNMTLLNAIAEFPGARCLQALLGGVLSLASSLDLARLDQDNPYPSENVYGPAQGLLTQLGRSRPVFLWTHTWPPHAPYLAPAGSRYQLLPQGELDHYRDFLTDVGNYDPSKQPVVDKLRLRYRETIRGADESLGRFLHELARQGRLENAVIVVTSDHGESFEKGVLGHGGPALHEALIHVPLLIKLPGQSVAYTVDTPTSQVDVAQTLVDIVDGKSIPGAEGRSLVPALQGRRLEPVPVFSMAIERESRFAPIRGGRYAVIDGNDKLVCQLSTDHCELFDVGADPGEARELSATRPDVAARLHALLMSRIAQAELQRSRRFDSH
jgi:arylsulfatase A-like enzyme